MSTQESLFFIQRFRGKVLFNAPMSEYTSMRVGGGADVMAFPKDEADLKDLILFAETKDFPFYVIGNGTNLLVRDKGYRGIIINMTDGFKDIRWLSDSKALAGAGVAIATLLNECAARGLSGLEFACGIPATLGAAVIMNAGAYGGEMKDIVDGVEVVGKKGQKGFLPKSELAFAYRKARIPKGSVVTGVHMNFEKRPVSEIQERIKGFQARRKTSVVPFPNAGSIFKNPEGKFAGALIEEAGFKGKTVGNAAVSDVHANYIVNTGGAKAKDVLSLMAEIRDTVYRNTGVLLEPEIKVIGED